MSDSGQDRRRVGDATRERIENLADGWKISRPDDGGDFDDSDSRSSVGRNEVFGEVDSRTPGPEPVPPPRTKVRVQAAPDDGRPETGPIDPPGPPGPPGSQAARGRPGAGRPRGDGDDLTVPLPPRGGPPQSPRKPQKPPRPGPPRRPPPPTGAASPAREAPPPPAPTIIESRTTSREDDATELMSEPPEGMTPPLANIPVRTSGRVPAQSPLANIPARTSGRVSAQSPAASPASPASPAGTASGSSAGSSSGSSLGAAPPPREAHRPLRTPPAFPRSKGVLGDLRYLFRVVFGVVSARKERRALEDKLVEEQHQREELLISLARQVIADPAIDLPIVATGREEMSEIEERRSRHAGGVVAADAELQTVERQREREAQANLERLNRLAAELEAIEVKLAPLEQEFRVKRRRYLDLDALIEGKDREIERLEARLSAADSGGDPVMLQAQIASAKADREALRRQEQPGLVAELEALEPKIAGLRSARAEARKQTERTTAREREAQARTEEKLTAIKARKVVEERGVADADRDRDQILLALGERLAVDRPDGVLPRLRGVEAVDVQIAVDERKVIELGELIAGISRLAVARGALYLLVLLGVIGGGVGAFLMLR